MAKIPKTAINKLDTVGVLNAVRNDIGGTYADIVPEADGTIENLRAIGDIITTYSVQANTFLDALVNRIGLVLVKAKLYTNPWSMFKKGMLELGESVEEVWVDLASPFEFNRDSAVNNVFKQSKPDVSVAFHSLNYRKFYKVTVTEDELRQAFISMQGVTDLIGRIIDSLSKSMNYDEFITMKYLIGRYAVGDHIYPTRIPAVSASNAKSIVTSMKSISNNLEFLSQEYNPAHVYNATSKNEQYLIMTGNFSAIQDVEVLASAFNMNKAEFLGHSVMVDSFKPTTREIARLNELFSEDEGYTAFTSQELADLDTIPAILIDKDFFMIYDNMLRSEAIRNPEGLYNNFFLHKWSIFSISPFSNAILFTTSSGAITAVDVTPATATVKVGKTQQCKATVTGTGFVDKSVTWSLTGAQSDDTVVDANGLVTIGSDESASTVIVTATSVADSTKTDTCVITVDDD